MYNMVIVVAEASEIIMLLGTIQNVCIMMIEHCPSEYIIIHRGLSDTHFGHAIVSPQWFDSFRLERPLFSN